MTEKGVIFGALATGAAFKFGALSWMGKRRQQEFVYVGSVSALYLYPVKSCRPTQIDKARCTETGLCYNGVTDRHWLVVGDNGSYICQRHEPSMALIQTRLLGKEVELSAPGVTSLKLNIDDYTSNAKPSKCRIRTHDDVQAMDCGDKAGAWISKYLSRDGCRIMLFIPGVTRLNVMESKTKWKTYAKEEDQANFGDFCSYFLLSEASLADLNTRLDNQMTMLSFRPNIVVTGCPAYAEDQWMEVRIGDKTIMRYIDSCPRCVLTTVDPYRGVKDPNQEPLKTLRTFRLQREKYGNAPLFGTYLGLEREGTVQVGDPVYALPWPKTP